MKKMIKKLLCAVAFLGCAPLHAICSFRLLKSPTGQLLLILGDDTSAKYVPNLRKFTSHIESAKLGTKPKVLMGLQELDSQQRTKNRGTPVTEELKKLIDASSSNAPQYTWVMPWDSVREFLTGVKTELYNYTMMLVTNEEMRSFYSLPAQALSSSPQQPQKRPLKEVQAVQKEAHKRDIEGGALNPWYQMTVTQFTMHLMITLSQLEDIASKYKSQPEIARVFSEQFIQPYQGALDSIRKIFKEIPKDDLLYDAIMGVLLSSDVPNDVLRFSYYWSKRFETDTQCLFIAACLFDRLMSDTSHPTCIIVYDDIAVSFSSILQKAFKWTLLKERALFSQVNPFVNVHCEDPHFETGLIRVSNQLLNSHIEHCACCFSAEELKQCSGCKSVKYCGSECQKEDRASHKELCKELAKKVVVLT